jgi:hypothetical protein
MCRTLLLALWLHGQHSHCEGSDDECKDPATSAVVASSARFIRAYLYGGPAKQVVRSAVGAQTGWFPVFAIALFGAYLLGYASWWLIEKLALRFKR